MLCGKQLSTFPSGEFTQRSTLCDMALLKTSPWHVRHHSPEIEEKADLIRGLMYRVLDSGDSSWTNFLFSSHRAEHEQYFLESCCQNFLRAMGSQYVMFQDETRQCQYVMCNFLHRKKGFCFFRYIRTRSFVEPNGICSAVAVVIETGKLDEASFGCTLQHVAKHCK